VHGESATCKVRPSQSWTAHAPELARWATTTLVNRTDVWGGYRPLHLREPGNPLGKILTKSAKKDRGNKFLTEEILARHFAGRDVGHVVGLHSISAENTSHWCAVDIDWHSEDSTNPEINVAAATSWYTKLTVLGFSPLLTDSNGAGGYHLLAVFSEPVATNRVFAFVRWLVSDHARYGLSEAPETFPKQARVAPGRFGNWLRLPSRHHTRDHWSTVWDGKTWLNGAAAVDHILASRGASARLIPEAGRAFQADQQPPPEAPRYRPMTEQLDGLARRIQAYVSRLPNLCEGQGRDDVAYRLAGFLVRDLNLSDNAAMPWLQH